MNRIVSLGLFAFLFAAHSLQAEPTITMYTNGDSIQDMVFSGEYIFCATTGGVVEWNTRDMSYKKFTMADGLPDNIIRSITKSPDGKVWCGTSKGIAIYNGTTWESYSEHTTTAWDIEFASDGALYVSGGNEGVRRLKGGTWTKLTAADGVPESQIRMIASGNDGTVAFASSGYGVGVITGSSKKIYTMKDGLPDNFILSVAVIDSNTIWAGTGYGIVRFDGTSWKTFTVKDGLVSNSILGIHIAPDGRIFIATDSGVSIYDGNSFTNITSELNLAKSYVYNILTGSDGARWYGCGNGLRREQADTFTIYRTRNVPAGNSIHDSALAPDGSVWFATQTGISRYFNGIFSNYGFDEGLPDRQVISIAVSGNNDVWAGTIYGGVVHFDGGKWTSFSIEDGLVAKRIEKIAIDSNGVVWCGSTAGWPNGLCYYKDGKWTQVSTDDGLLSSYITDISIGPSNDVWVGTDSGASCFSGGKWISYTTKEGLPGNYVKKTHVLKDNTVIIITKNGGVLFDGTKMSSFSHTLFSNVNDITGDTMDNLKFATSSGMLELVAKDTWNLYSTTLFLKSDYTPETNIFAILPVVPVTLITIDYYGTWWCSTVENLISVEWEPTLVNSENGLPSHFAILGNYPNPFNPSTTIEYSLSETGMANLAIYSITGQKVRELVAGIIPAGKHSIFWDGRDQAEKAVSGGIYFCRMKCGAQVVCGKMLFLK